MGFHLEAALLAGTPFPAFSKLSSLSQMLANMSLCFTEVFGLTWSLLTRVLVGICQRPERGEWLTARRLTAGTSVCQVPFRAPCKQRFMTP